MDQAPETAYCHYIESVCPEKSTHPIPNSLFFAYPSEPETSADAIKGAIDQTRNDRGLNIALHDWRDLPIEGNIIFCEICKAICKSGCVVLNITKANFNVLFEYGFALGLGKALWPIVEEGIDDAGRSLSEIETLTTLGYARFTNSRTLYRKITRKQPWLKKSTFKIPPTLASSPSMDAMGLLYLKSIHNNEPSLRISEALSLLPMEVIVDDPSETPFQSLYWYLKQLGKAYAVLVNLGNPRMVGVQQHWAKCAFVAGIALALGRRTLMIGEGITLKPIDYRDLIKNYKNASRAERIVSEFTMPIVTEVKSFREETAKYITGKLGESPNAIDVIDLGDYIAENEMEELSNYFVETAAFLDSFTPQFKVFVGRKGMGKTANFYMILNKLIKDKRNIVCQIKPKEYELNELLCFVKSELSIAKKGYLLESLWKFMLYSEILKTLESRIREKPLQAIVEPNEKAITDYIDSNSGLYKKSFTSRLVEIVGALCKSAPKGNDVAVSEILHSGEIVGLHKMVCTYIGRNVSSFTIIVDGLDANWRLGEDYELMADIILSLIGAARDMWRSCKNDIVRMKETVRVSTLIFLRGDVFKVVLDRAREPDKLIYTLIYWQHMEPLLKIIEKRIINSIGQTEGQSLTWQSILEPGFTPKLMTEMLENNILQRPRDIICYFQNAVYYARNRGTPYITKRDFKSAMKEYSEYAFRSLAAESQPFIPNMADLLLEFSERQQILSIVEVYEIMEAARIKREDFSKALNFLLESNFVGYGIDEHNYRFPTSPEEADLTLKRAIRHSSKKGKPRMFKIHRAFHEALAIT